MSVAPPSQSLTGPQNLPPPPKKEGRCTNCCLMVIITRIWECVRDIFMAIVNVFRCGKPEDSEKKQLRERAVQLEQENLIKAETEKLLRARIKEIQDTLMKPILPTHSRQPSIPFIPRPPAAAPSPQPAQLSDRATEASLSFNSNDPRIRAAREQEVVLVERLKNLESQVLDPTERWKRAMELLELQQQLLSRPGSRLALERAAFRDKRHSSHSPVKPGSSDRSDGSRHSPGSAPARLGIPAEAPGQNTSDR